MESEVKIYERVTIRDPTLIVGVSGIGLVANVVATHVIMRLEVKKLGEIKRARFVEN